NMQEKIRSLFIFEILGKPAEHIKKSLEELIEKLGKQKGIQIVKKQVHEPKKLDEESKKGKVIVGEGLFTTFAEVEIITENISLVLGIVLNMLPSHVEIIEPNEYRFKNFELSSLLTELTVKIHKYDEIAKILMFERKNILDKLRETEERVRELEKEIKQEKNA
ncbi:MAG: hypothetical protein AABX77_01485, partial [Nanoarchaeota archaeon]